jgi:antitoxin ParD1/3/4
MLPHPRSEEVETIQTTEKLSITLPREMAEMIRGKVQAGSYASNSEVIREALRLLQEREGEKAEKLAWMRTKIEHSLADPRPSVEADEGLARLKERHRRQGEDRG